MLLLQKRLFILLNIFNINTLINDNLKGLLREVGNFRRKLPLKKFLVATFWESELSENKCPKHPDLKPTRIQLNTLTQQHVAPSSFNKN